jgi:hypothetical protein
MAIYDVCFDALAMATFFYCTPDDNHPSGNEDSTLGLAAPL